MQDRRVGKLGLKLPEISLGLWHNFGGIAPRERSREIVRRAFELGITSAGRTSR
jgi:L-glyceraldehyde 3-phosphate reductase